MSAAQLPTAEHRFAAPERVDTTARDTAALTATDLPVHVLDESYERRVRDVQRRHGPGSAAEHRVIRAYAGLHLAALLAATPSSEDDLDLAVAIANGVA